MSVKIYHKKNLIKLICEVLFLFLISIIATLFISLFCEIFYEFSNIAKEQIKKNTILNFLLFPLLLWISAIICRVAGRNASGNIIEHISNALLILKTSPNNYQKIKHLIGFRLIIIAIISSLIATISGGSLGREGVAIFIACGWFLSCGYYFRKFLPDINLESWIYLGYSLGLAVAFNAPIAGIIYVCEKLIKNNSNYFFKTISLCLSVILVVWIIIKDNKPIYNIEKINFEVSFYEFVWLSGLMIGCAIIIHIFKNSSNFLYNKIAKLKGIKWHFVILFCSLLIILIGNFIGVYAIGGGIKTVNDAFGNQDIFLGINDFFGRFITTILTFIIGSSGGIVAPSIALGAGFSSSLSLDFFSGFNLHFLMIAGMVGFLSPILASPITAGFVIFEATRQDFSSLLILIPLSVISYLSYQLINKFIKQLLIIKNNRQ